MRFAARHGIDMNIILFTYLCSIIQQVFIWWMNIPGTMLGTGRYNWNSDTVWISRANCLVRDMCTNMIIPLQCDQYWEKFIHWASFDMTANRWRSKTLSWDNEETSLVMPKLSPRGRGESQANFGDREYSICKVWRQESSWTGMAQSIVDYGKNLEFKAWK